MTVSGEDAVARFEEIFREYMPRIRKFIWTRLDIGQYHLAEDLTQETFSALWTHYLAKGQGVDSPFSLLCAIGKNQVLAHQSWLKNNEMTLDYSDPATTPIVTTGHMYAADSPDLAHLSRELEQAMEEMTKASSTWRSANKAVARMAGSLHPDAVSGLTPETKSRMEQQIDVADMQERATLESFRQACAEVGRLRSELEAAGGANWRSSTGMPPSAGTSPIRKGGMSDPAVTHCPEGHLLDRRTTLFAEDGRKMCRPCRAAAYATKQKPEQRNGRAVPQDVIDKARAMVNDPDCTLSLAAIGQMVGATHQTLSNRLRPEMAARRARRAAAKAGAAR